jgi:D-glycero-alpha-D-manno-heptose-7-phosphate kinase
MIITRTPLRISFVGGGSDLKEFYSKFGGSVLSTSIDKYIYLSMHPYFNGEKYFLKYSQNELVGNVEDIKHPILRQLFKDYKIKGVDFNSSADIPSGTGLGSSSSFTAGLTTLCNAYTKKYMNQEEIAEYACQVEIEKLGEPIGKQDQYACAVGGLNFIQFEEDESVKVQKIILEKDKRIHLQNNLMMFYLGETRKASSILAKQRTNTIKDEKTIKNLKKMVDLSIVLKKELQNGNIDAMGDILHRGWMYKKELTSNISNSSIDQYYDLALKNGALGGKLLGAGGGGFLLFYVPEEFQKNVRESLKNLNELKFNFSTEGTKVIHYEV